MGNGNVHAEVMESLRTKALPIALVGASNDPEKYGNIILKNLVNKGYSMIPINPKEAEIEGIPAVPSVKELTQEIAFLNFVVPPKVTLSILPLAKAAGIRAVWFQDGSFDDAVLAYAKENFPVVVSHACVMVVTNFV